MNAGFTIGGSAHPICPVMLGDARLASVMANDMLKIGEKELPCELSLNHALIKLHYMHMFGKFNLAFVGYYTTDPHYPLKSNEKF